MDIIMIRHGQSEANLAKIFGTEDTRLSKEGIRQIKRAKEHIDTLSFSKVYVSPFARTKETLHHLGFQAKEDKRIQEYDFGIFSGLTNEEIEKKYPLEYQEWIENPMYYKIPEGESLQIVYRRVKNFLEEIIEKNENVLLVTHAGIIRLAFCWVFNKPEYFFKFKVTNGSVNIITVNEDNFKYIKQVNFSPR